MQANRVDHSADLDPAPAVPLACSLRGGAVADRRRWLGDLQRRALSVERSAGDLTIAFPSDDGLEAELRALADAESECCGFLRVSVRAVGDSLELVVAGPPDAQPIIDEMFGDRS
jgi:hypothetical protein